MARGTDLRVFALEATERLREISDDLGQLPGLKYDGARLFAGTLAGALLRVNECLKTQAPHSTDEHNLVLLLMELEKSCKWPNIAVNAPQGQQANSVPPEKRFPTLAKLRWRSMKPHVVRETINKFAQDKTGKGTPLARQKHLLEILNNFSKTQSSKLKIRLDATNLDAYQKDDHNGSVQSLYDALEACCACGDKVDTRITLNLRLSIERDKETEMPTFNVLFRLHPHQETRQSSWRNTTIAASSTTPSEIIDRRSFCPTICRVKTFRSLRLLLTGALLTVAGEGDVSRWVQNQDKPSVTLRTILARPEYHIGPKPRYLLQFLLAKALWQFYDTDWMRIPWTADNVLFLAERRGRDHGAFLNEPFIKASFEASTRAAKTEGGPSEGDKIFAIRAFGVMLMEIELRISMDEEMARIPECCNADNDDEYAKQAYAAQVLFEDGERMDSVPNPLRAVICTCLKPPRIPERASMRLTIHSDIVAPIESMLRQLYGAPEAIVLRGPIGPAQGSRMRPLAAEKPIPQPDILAPRPQTSPRAVMSKGWFGDLDKLNKVLQPLPGDTLPSSKPIIIAILDTGIDPSYRFSRFLAGYKDFVDKDSTKRIDNTGHGTRAVELVFKVFDRAEVYLGRVFRRSDEDDNTKDLMTEGIRWAREECKADIITMASGFSREHPGIEDEIKKASLNNVLVFASASNYGNMRRVSFPGRMKHHVFCIYSTNGKGKIADESARINPPERPRATNFAIFGEGISLRDLENEPEGSLLTGTSYATSIAAALAGQLLDFSRQKQPSSQIRKVKDLRTFAGMEAVLLRLSQPSSAGGGYSCIVPFRLIENCADEHRQVQRHRVCEAVSDALENMYST